MFNRLAPSFLTDPVLRRRNPPCPFSRPVKAIRIPVPAVHQTDILSSRRILSPAHSQRPVPFRKIRHQQNGTRMPFLYGLFQNRESFHLSRMQTIPSCRKVLFRAACNRDLRAVARYFMYCPESFPFSPLIFFILFSAPSLSDSLALSCQACTALFGKIQRQVRHRYRSAVVDRQVGKIGSNRPADSITGNLPGIVSAVRHIVNINKTISSVSCHDSFSFQPMRTHSAHLYKYRVNRQTEKVILLPAAPYAIQTTILPVWAHTINNPAPRDSVFVTDHSDDTDHSGDTLPPCRSTILPGELFIFISQELSCDIKD